MKGPKGRKKGGMDAQNAGKKEMSDGVQPIPGGGAINSVTPNACAAPHLGQRGRADNTSMMWQPMMPSFGKGLER